MLLKIFQRPQDAQPSPNGDDLGGLGESLNKHFGRCNPAKIAKHVYVCIACWFYPEFGIKLVSNAALSTAMPISWISRTGALML